MLTRDTKMQELQNFQITAPIYSCKWGPFYNVLNLPMLVIKICTDVQTTDETYNEAVMNSQFGGSMVHACMDLFHAGT